MLETRSIPNHPSSVSRNVPVLNKSAFTRQPVLSAFESLEESRKSDLARLETVMDWVLYIQKFHHTVNTSPW